MSASLEQNTENTASWRAILADRLGICLSLLCVVHCILTPVALILLPSFAYVFHDERFHLGLLIVLPTVALLAFIPGYRLHRDIRVFQWGILGLALIAVAVLLFHDSIWAEALISISGSACLIRAHIVNRRLCACCQAGHPSSLPFRAVKRKLRLKPVSTKKRAPLLMRTPPKRR